jgi:DNA-binding protein Fis
LPLLNAARQRRNIELEAFIRQRLQPDSRDLYSEAHGQVDRFLLTRVLEYTGGSQHKAARLLGIARQTLRLKLRDLGLHVAQSVDSECSSLSRNSPPIRLASNTR